MGCDEDIRQTFERSEADEVIARWPDAVLQFASLPERQFNDKRLRHAGKA